MDVTTLYSRMLRLPPPWTVTRVEVSDKDRRIDVWIDHAPGIAFACPKCGTALPVYDHVPERVWRHLDTCEYETLIHAKLPRVNCSYHGTIQVAPPNSDPHSRLTHAMECRAIDILKECNRTGAATLTKLTWNEVDAVMDRSVKRGLARRGEELPEWLGIDEKNVFARHKYFTIIADLMGGRVLDVIDKRTIEAVSPWFKARKAELAAVKGVAMDMSAGYAKVVTSLVPNAKICFDHFHVTMVVNKAVDEVRKQDQKSLGEGEGKVNFFRSRFLFLCNSENVPEHRAEEFEKLRALALKTSRAWAIKENFRDLWKCKTIEDAEAFFKKWYWWATHSRLEPVRRAAHTVKNHWVGIKNAILEKISNACTEGLNSKIEKIKRDAYGFRSKESFRTAILFHCGDLSLYPKTA